MNIFFKPILIAGVVLSLTACTTITRGTRDTLIVNTTPSGAQVSLSNGMTCSATPCSFRVSRKMKFVAKISKKGYKTTAHSISTRVAGAGSAGMAGNVLVGGLIGAGVDVVTGAMLDHAPNPLEVTLEPKDNEETPELGRFDGGFIE